MNIKMELYDIIYLYIFDWMDKNINYNKNFI